MCEREVRGRRARDVRGGGERALRKYRIGWPFSSEWRQAVRVQKLNPYAVMDLMLAPFGRPVDATTMLAES